MEHITNRFALVQRENRDGQVMTIYTFKTNCAPQIKTNTDSQFHRN